MTSNEKIAVVVGGVGVAYFVFGGSASAAPAKKLAAVPALKKATPASALSSLLRPATGGTTSSGRPSGTATLPTPPDVTPRPPAPPVSPKAPTDAGPSDWADAFATNDDNVNSGLNPNGPSTVPSGPLTYSDGSTIDLNAVDPNTGQQLFVVPTQPDGGDSQGLIRDATDWSAGGDGGDVDEATPTVTATIYGATVDAGVDVTSVPASETTVASGGPAGFDSWDDYYAQEAASAEATTPPASTVTSDFPSTWSDGGDTGNIVIDTGGDPTVVVDNPPGPPDDTGGDDIIDLAQANAAFDWSDLVIEYGTGYFDPQTGEWY